MHYYIGIDLGTSAMKLLLMDVSGTIYNTISKEYPLEFPEPGWSQQNPEDWKTALFEKISKIMLPKDYISYILTGVHSCDYSDASGMLLDVKHKCWSKEMLEICDILESQMPKLIV